MSEEAGQSSGPKDNAQQEPTAFAHISGILVSHGLLKRPIDVPSMARRDANDLADAIHQLLSQRQRDVELKQTLAASNRALESSVERFERFLKVEEEQRADAERKLEATKAQLSNEQAQHQSIQTRLRKLTEELQRSRRDLVEAQRQAALHKEKAEHVAKANRPLSRTTRRDARVQSTRHDAEKGVRRMEAQRSKDETVGGRGTFIGSGPSVATDPMHLQASSDDNIGELDDDRRCSSAQAHPREAAQEIVLHETDVADHEADEGEYVSKAENGEQFDSSRGSRRKSAQRNSSNASSREYGPPLAIAEEKENIKRPREANQDSLDTMAKRRALQANDEEQRLTVTATKMRSVSVPSAARTDTNADGSNVKQAMSAIPRMVSGQSRRPLARAPAQSGPHSESTVEQEITAGGSLGRSAMRKRRLAL